MICVCASWVPPCHGLSSWIAGGADTLGFSSIWPDGPDAVDRGDVYWITIISENLNGAAPDVSDAVDYANDYASDAMPVLADTSQVVPDYLGLVAWPSLALLEPTLEVEIFDPHTYGPVLETLALRYP